MLIFSSGEQDAVTAKQLADFFVAPFNGHGWSEQALEEALHNERHRFYFAYEGSELVGVLHVSTIIDEAEILNIAVAQKWQQQGIGEKLLLEGLQMLATQKIVKLYLEVRLSNTPARHMYEKIGFVKDGFRKHYYQNPPESAALYHFDLKEVEK